MRKLDARGLECPLPVVKTKELLKESNEAVEVLVDNETAVENLKKFAKVKGYDAVSNKVNEDYTVVISSGEQVVEEKKADNILKGQIVVLSSDSLGSDKELGKILMKSFIFALTKQDAFPETILFYNEGVKITTQESDTVNDLLFQLNNKRTTLPPYHDVELLPHPKILFPNDQIPLLSEFNE